MQALLTAIFLGARKNRQCMHGAGEMTMLQKKLKKFSGQVQEALVNARQEAASMSCRQVNTGHLLLGIMRAQEPNAATMALENAAISYEMLRPQVEHISAKESQESDGEVVLTNRSKKVIELAVIESHQLQQDSIRSEHILLAILREGEGLAAILLEAVMPLGQLRESVVRLSKTVEQPVPSWRPDLMTTDQIKHAIARLQVEERRRLSEGGNEDLALDTPESDQEYVGY